MEHLFNDTYLVAFDAFHGQFLFAGLSMVLAVLPTLAIAIIIYYLVSSFVLVTLTDRNFARWCVTTLVTIFTAHILLGGIQFKGIDGRFHNLIAPPTEAQSQLTRVNRLIVYSTKGLDSTLLNGGGVNRHSYKPNAVSGFFDVPFDAQAWMFDDDVSVLADYSMELASQEVKKATKTESADDPDSYISVYSITTNQLQDTPLLQNWSAVNRRLLFTPAFSNTLLYLNNSFMSFAYSSGQAGRTAGIADVKEQEEKRIAKTPSGKNAAPVGEDGNEARVGDIAGDPVKEHAQNQQGKLGVTIANATSLNTFIIGSNSKIGEEDAKIAQIPTGQLIISSYKQGYLDKQAFMRYCSNSTGVADSSSSNLGISGNSSAGLSGVLSPCNIQATNGFYKSGTPTQSNNSCLLGNVDPTKPNQTCNGSMLTSAFGGLGTVGTNSGTACSPTASLSEVLARYSALPDDKLSTATQPCAALGASAATNTDKVYDNLQEHIRLEAARDSDGSEYLAYYSDSSDSESLAVLGQENLATLAEALRSLFQPLAMLQTNGDAKLASNALFSTSVAHQISNKDTTDTSQDRSGLLATIAGLAVALNITTDTTLASEAVSFAGNAVNAMSASAVTGYAMTYYATIIGASLGFMMLPLWIILTTGKILANGAGGDTRNNLSLFPIAKFLGYPLILGSQLAVLAVAHSQTIRFLTNAQNNALDAASQSVTSLQGAVTGSSGAYSDSISTIIQATEIIGIMIGLSTIPMLLLRLVRGDNYSPESSMNSQMQSLQQQASIDDKKVGEATGKASSLVSSFQNIMKDDANAQNGLQVRGNEQDGGTIQNAIKDVFSSFTGGSK